MNNELANCRVNPSARLFSNQNCDSNSEPNVNAVSNFNSSTLTNPYDKNEKVVGSNLCNKGTVGILVQYFRFLSSPICFTKERYQIHENC